MKYAYPRNDLGISLARRFGIDATVPSPSLSQAEYDDITRTYRTLVHLQWSVRVAWKTPW
jgi:hypothetical protein